MIDLDKLMDEWEKESKVGQHLDDESRRSPTLHAKYLRLYNKAKFELHKAEQEHEILKKNKWLHFNGKLSKQEIDDLGWDYDPLNGLKILKGDIGQFYSADPDLQKSQSKIEYCKMCTDTIREIMDNIKWRHQSLKVAMDYLRFESGA